jgi:hypothetical protein
VTSRVRICPNPPPDGVRPQPQTDLVAFRQNSGQFRQLYFARTSFAACLSLPLSYLATPRLQYLFLMTWEVVMWVDFPVSIVSIFFAWRYQLFAATWIFVAGALWWYFLALRMQTGHFTQNPLRRVNK